MKPFQHIRQFVIQQRFAAYDMQFVHHAKAGKSMLHGRFEIFDAHVL